MRLAEADDRFLDDPYQTAWSSAGESLSSDDPWFMPRNDLGWYDNYGHRHDLYVVSNSCDCSDKFFGGIEALIDANRHEFPDLYENV